jgi:predicted GIY-YIG superfamily endonuclease
MAYYVYILASRQHGTLTIGVTNDIARRAWKIRLIERDNPEWDDLLQPLGTCVLRLCNDECARCASFRRRAHDGR